MASSKKLVQRMGFPSHFLYERKKVKSLISKPYLLELCVKHCGSEVSWSHCQKYICLKWHSAGNLWREWLSGSWPHIYPTNHVHLHWELKAAPTHDVKDIFFLLLKNILFFIIEKIFYENVWMNIYVKESAHSTWLAGYMYPPMCHLHWELKEIPFRWWSKFLVEHKY